MLSIGIEPQEHVPDERHHSLFINAFGLGQFATHLEELVAGVSLPASFDFAEQDEGVWELCIRDEIGLDAP